MGIVDVFDKEDRVQITVSQLRAVLTAQTERDVILRGIVNRVPHAYIEALAFGDKTPKKDGNGTPDNKG